MRNIMKELAAECAAELSEKEIDYIRLHLNYIDHHFGFGLYLRNTYFERYRKETGSDNDSRDDFSPMMFFYILAELFPQLGDDIEKIRFMCNEKFSGLAAYYYIRRKRMLFEDFSPDGFRFEAFHPQPLQAPSPVTDTDMVNPFEPDVNEYIEYNNIMFSRLNSWLMPAAENLWERDAIEDIPQELIDEMYSECKRTFAENSLFIPLEAVYFIAGRPDLLSDDVLLQLELILKNDCRKAELFPPCLLNNRGFAKIMVGINGYCLRYVPHFSRDREIVKTAVGNAPTVLEAADRSLKNDPEIVRCAISKNGIALMYAGRRLKNDPELLRLAIRNSKQDVILACPFMKKYRDDDEIVKLTLIANGYNIIYASKRIRDDFVLARCALRHKRSPQDHIFSNLSPRLRDNKELAMTELKNPVPEVEHFSDRLKDDDEIAALLYRHRPKRKLLYLMSERIRRNYNLRRKR